MSTLDLSLKDLKLILPATQTMASNNRPYLGTLQTSLLCDGFTLIELMLVMTLLSAIAWLTAPALSHWLQRQRIDAAARDFLSHLGYAQHEAIVHRYPVTLCRVDQTGQCSVQTQHCAKHHATPNDWGCGYAVRIEKNTIGPPSHLLSMLPFNTLGEVSIQGSGAPLIFRPLTGQIGGLRRFEFSLSSSIHTSSVHAIKRCIYLSIGGRARLVNGACTSL